MLQAHPVRATLPEVQHHLVRLLGTGAAACTVELGNGITVTRPAIGRILLTWGDSPGVYVGFTHGLQAATPGDLKGYTVVADTYDAANKQLEFSVFDSANA